MLGGVVRFEGGYLVPRGDGRYVLGATVQERGFNLAPEVGGIYELLRDAHEVVPGVSELEIEELSVGLRPGTPDNAPAIGTGALEGLGWATGHHRNGILLAPVTAALALEALTGGEAIASSEALTGGEAFESSEAVTGAALLAACDPLRFVPASEEIGAWRQRDESAVGRT